MTALSLYLSYEAVLLDVDPESSLADQLRNHMDAVYRTLSMEDLAMLDDRRSMSPEAKRRLFALFTDESNRIGGWARILGDDGVEKEMSAFLAGLAKSVAE